MSLFRAKESDITRKYGYGILRQRKPEAQVKSEAVDLEARVLLEERVTVLRNQGIGNEQIADVLGITMRRLRWIISILARDGRIKRRTTRQVA